MKAKSEGEGVANVRTAMGQRILRVAAELFAERGFYAVSIRDIARAGQVSAASVLYHAGSKQQLIERILNEAFSSQVPLFQLASQIDSDDLASRDEFFEFTDQFVEALIQHELAFPNTRRLWLLLSLDDPELFRKLDAQFSQPLMRQALELLQSLRNRGILFGDDQTLQHVISGLDWMLDGFFIGASDNGCGRDHSIEAAKIARFADFLKSYVRSCFAH